MSPEEAVDRISVVLAHAWMVRNFLKHAEDIEDDEEMLGVHRMIYDYIRAMEPSKEKGDHKEFLRRARNKLSKLKRVADYFAEEWREVSSHTNFEMASMSLSGCVRQIEEILGQVDQQKSTGSDT